MKRILCCLFLCLLFMVIQAETVVYVGGLTTDGIDKEPVYWRNGVMCHFFSNKIPEGAYLGMAVENGLVYMCLQQRDKICVYKSGLLMFEFDVDHEKFSSMAVLNNKVYIGMYDYGYYYDPYYYLVKNGDKEHLIKHVGKYIVAEGGILYSTSHPAESKYTEKVCGYYAGGRWYGFPKESYDIRNMRVIDGNVYMMNRGILINTQEKRFRLDKDDELTCDFAIIGNDFFYLIWLSSSRKYVLQNQWGNDILEGTPYVPHQIIGKGGKLYILIERQRGAVKETAYLVYNPTTKALESIRTLPSCADVNAFYVVDENDGVTAVAE